MIWILEWLEFNGQKPYSLSKSIVLSAQLANTSYRILIVLGSSPNHAYLLSDFFWPPYQVSTQSLSSSTWLTRGGRCRRCVHFCAMHSQCLPKTVVGCEFWWSWLTALPPITSGTSWSYTWTLKENRTSTTTCFSFGLWCRPDNTASTLMTEVQFSLVHSHLFFKVTGFYRPVKPSLKVN